MAKICVFCGARDNLAKHYHDAATELGYQLAAANHTLVYGGSIGGLMGSLANAALDNGGEVISILSESLTGRELPHHQLSQIIYEPSLSNRKNTMFSMGDAFIILPGGYGTLDEFFSLFSENRNDDVQKPFALLNVGEFYTPLIKHLRDSIQANGFASAQMLDAIIIEADVDVLMRRLASRLPSNST